MGNRAPVGISGQLQLSPPSGIANPTGTGAAGHVNYYQVQSGAGYKLVSVYVNAMKGSATFSFPAYFTHQPTVRGDTAVTALVTAISATSITINNPGGTAVSGNLFIEGAN